MKAITHDGFGIQTRRQLRRSKVSEMDDNLIMLVESDHQVADKISMILRNVGYEVEVIREHSAVVARVRDLHPDLVLLDSTPPRSSGTELCAEIRRFSSVPIIIVSSSSAEVDTVIGLELGADDYNTKPYRGRELTARIRAVLRRKDRLGEPPPDLSKKDPEPTIRIGGLSICSLTHEVRVRNNRVPMPLKEFELLLFLMEQVGLVQTREMLIERVWGHDYVGDTKTLDVHIKRLRTKIEDNPSAPRRIVTVRGVGYKFARAAG